MRWIYWRVFYCFLFGAAVVGVHWWLSSDGVGLLIATLTILALSCLFTAWLATKLVAREKIRSKPQNY